MPAQPTTITPAVTLFFANLTAAGQAKRALTRKGHETSSYGRIVYTLAPEAAWTDLPALESHRYDREVADTYDDAVTAKLATERGYLDTLTRTRCEAVRDRCPADVLDEMRYAIGRQGIVVERLEAAAS